jgi:hypothetical protein
VGGVKKLEGNTEYRRMKERGVKITQVTDRQIKQ